MTGPDRDNDWEGVRFVHEDDGRITAVDLETGVASFGDTKTEALRMLAEALELHEGGGVPVTDEGLQEWGLDPDAVPECSCEEAFERYERGEISLGTLAEITDMPIRHVLAELRERDVHFQYSTESLREDLPDS